MTDAFIRPQRYSDAEWQARVQLAACYRIFAHLGWSELIYNHISLRVPDEEGHFLINPFGLHYTEVTASNLVFRVYTCSSEPNFEKSNTIVLTYTFVSPFISFAT